MTRQTLRLLVALTLILPAYATAQPDINATFSAGAAAFEAGDLDTALEAFESVRAIEGPSVETDFALGLVLYRMGEHEDAELLLTGLVDSEQGPRSAYYLGRIAEARGDYPSARAWFTRAADQYDDLEVQAWADDSMMALMFVDESSPTQRTPRSYAFLSTHTNVVDGILDPNDTTVVDAQDTSLSVLFAGTLAVWNRTSYPSLSVGGAVYRENYSEFSEYDIASTNVFTELDGGPDRYEWGLRLGYTEFQFGGEDYVDHLDLSFSNEFELSNGLNLLASARLTDVTSPTVQYLRYEGELRDFNIGLGGGDRLNWRVDLGYRVEDRLDETTVLVNDSGQTFLGFRSYSRDIQRLSGRLSWDYNSYWYQVLEAGLRQTDYHDPDLFLTDSNQGSLTVLTRSADRITLRAEVGRWIGNRLKIVGLVEYLDEDANIDIYDFDSLLLSIGLDYMF
ncbi:MAG: tetratricopeptide repeat protein [Gammaproteobacteria bacterium]